VSTASPKPALPPFLYGTAWKEERTAELTELALRSGFRGIDTANQRRHYFEAAVGEGLASAISAGVVTRDDVFIQTKYTYQAGQDHRLPYDPAAPLSRQVEQSLESSLEHLGTDRVDSFVLHGPVSGRGWTRDDREVWLSMAGQRHQGRARSVGLSNVSLLHLVQMMDIHRDDPPRFVQNRCFARLGWDRDVRAFCRDHDVVYQGFSLLTANPEVMGSRLVASLAGRYRRTPAAIVFAFARSVGMLPLTGTSDEGHMRQDLAALDLTLDPDEVAQIESLSG
jgi:diketogulonate reductase-like aldo/keto reductase